MKKSNSTEQGVQRFHMERINEMKAMIETGKYNAAQLAQHFNRSDDIIYSDIALMRRMGHDIERDPIRNAYYYATPAPEMVTPHVTRQEIEALNVLDVAIAGFQGIPRMQVGRKALQKVFGRMTLDYPKGWKRVISFHTSAPCIFRADIYDNLFIGAIFQKQIRVLYRKPGKDNEYELRILNVHHLAMVDTEWFIFAYDVVSGKMRTYIPARMKSVEFTGKKFKRHKFSIKERLKHSFKIFDGEKLHDILIHFEADIADFIREKKWGGQVAIRDLADGGVELHLRLSSLSEVSRWLNGWDGQAVPKNNEELLRMMLDKARNTVAKLEAELARCTMPQKSPTVPIATATPPHIATAKAAPNNEMEKTLAVIATWSPEERAEFLKRVSA